MVFTLLINISGRVAAIRWFKLRLCSCPSCGSFGTMKRYLFAAALLALLGTSLLTGCSKKEEAPPAAPSTNAPARP
jgi:hypothetical protein